MLKEYTAAALDRYLCVQESTKEETGTMKGYFSKCVRRLSKSFPFSASNKCEAQTTAEAFYGAPAP